MTPQLSHANELTSLQSDIKTVVHEDEGDNSTEDTTDTADNKDTAGTKSTAGNNGSVITQSLTDTSDVLSDSRLEVLKNIERIKAEHDVNIWIVVEPSVSAFSDDFTLENWCSATAKASDFGKNDVLLVIQTARHDMAVWVNSESQFISKKQAQNELDILSTYLIQDNWSSAVMQFTKDIEKYAIKSNDVLPYVIVAIVVFMLGAILSYGRLNKSTNTVVRDAINNVKLQRSLKKIGKDSEMIESAVNVSGEILDDLNSRIENIAESAAIQGGNTGSVGQVSNGFFQASEKSIRSLTDKITKNHVINKYLRLGSDIDQNINNPVIPLHDTAESIPVVTPTPPQPESTDSIYSDYYTNSYSREMYGSYYHSDDNKNHDEKINSQLEELDRQIEEFTRGSSISSTFRKNHSDVRKYYVKEDKKAARKENKEKKQFHSRFNF